MLAGADSETKVANVIMNRLTDWATLHDYDRAKAAATNQIIRRQARGNVVVQNGWSMTAEKLLDQSREADKAVLSLRRAMNR